MNRSEEHTNSAVYEFGNFRLDVGKGLISRLDVPIQLQGKSFQLLQILVESDGRLISRDELMELLWPGTFVEENNLSQHIRALRAALSEGGKAFIETVPRRGLRFLPEVRVFSSSATNLPTKRDGLQSLAVVPELDHSFEASELTEALAGAGSALIFRPLEHRRSYKFALLGLLAALLFVATYVAFFRQNNSNDAERINVYANKIKLASQALNASNFELLNRLLNELKPEPGELDQRGFEWGYLAGMFAEAKDSQPMMLAHGSGVDAVAFSPDGNILATAAFDNIVRTWNLNTGDELASFRGHTALITYVGFSPDGKKLISTGFDQKAKVWDLLTGQELFTQTDNAASARFSIDGSAIVIADGSALVFRNPTTGAELERRKIPVEVGAFAFSPDEKLLAIRGPDQSIHIFGAGAYSSVSTITGHSDWVMDFQFSPDSTLLVTASKDGTAKLWDVRSGKQVHSFKGHSDELFEVEFSPDGKTVATGSNDDTVKLWDVRAGFEITTVRGHPGNVIALAFSPDGRRLASSGGDGFVRVWNVPAIQRRGVLRGHSESVTHLMFSASGRMLVSSSRDKTVRVWDVDSETERLTLGSHKDALHSGIFAADGGRIVTISEDKKIQFWDPTTGRELLSIESPVPATNLAISPDGILLATGHTFHDGMLRFWDLSSGKMICETPVHKGGLWSVGFIDNTRVVTASIDEPTISIWNPLTCTETTSFAGSKGVGNYLWFGPDKSWRAMQILNNGRSLRWFEPETGRELATFSGSQAILTDAKFSPDEKRVVTADEAGMLRIWDSATGLELLSIPAMVGEDNLAFSPDGKTIAVGESDGTIRLFRSVLTD
ncbi:MAG: winged helix-turn-helix domain-containing protein [Acidobacteriota bacterium]